MSSHNRFNKSFSPDDEPRRPRNDRMRSPMSHRKQQENNWYKRKTPPPAPKPCFITQFVIDEEVALAYDRDAKILFPVPEADATQFPSRKTAKAALFWYVTKLLEADPSLDKGATFRQYMIVPELF